MARNSLRQGQKLYQIEVFWGALEMLHVDNFKTYPYLGFWSKAHEDYSREL